MTRTFPRILLCGALMSASAGNLAFGQVWNPACASCAPQPIAQYVQPQVCYTSVPVTEYREDRRIVQKPVYETKYIDQQVTTYDPVVEDREVQIPTVSYQNVTECRPVTRDYGGWTAQYQSRHKPTACQYDNRPDVFGLLNRIGYSITSAFVPNYRVQHAYVSNIQTVNVPMTRRVAVHGTRKVNHRVTRYVPHTTTQKVAVNTVKMVSQEVVTRRPVTVYRSVPLGTSLATYAAPSSNRLGRAPAPGPDRTARRIDDHSHRQPSRVPKRSNRDAFVEPEGDVEETEPAAAVEPTQDTKLAQYVPQVVAPKKDSRLAGYRSVGSARSSAVRVGRWIARRPAKALPQGPEFPANILAKN